MTGDEVRAFLAVPRTLHVATLNRDGSPHLVPMWYALTDQGEIGFWTYTRSQKIQNLRRDPRITVMAEDGKAYGELRGVQISGVARLSTEPAEVTDIGARIYERHVGRLDEGARAGVAHAARKRIRVTVEARRVVSWDHRRLGGGY